MHHSQQPLSLRVSVTDLCQLRCKYCMPETGIKKYEKSNILSFEEINSLVTCLQNSFGIAKIRITGGEPLVRPGIESLISMLSAHDIPDIGMTTNGLLLAEKASALKLAGLSRINISLDALSPRLFAALTCGGDVQAVIAGICAAGKAGLTPVKLNTVVIGGTNEAETAPLLNFAIENNCELRFIELMPIGPGANLHPEGFVSSAALRQKLSTRFSFTKLPLQEGSSAVRYKVVTESGRTGTAGFISSCSEPFCSGCRRLRLTADGRLIGCLARNSGISIRESLRSGNMREIGTAVFTALEGKRTDSNFEQSLAMTSVGG